MENKEYKYKDLTFKPVKRTLKFHSTNYHFIKDLQSKILTDDKLDDEKYWLYIHDEENIKTIITKFLDGETDKININVETDDDYRALIDLVVTVLNDFFVSYKPIMK